MSFKTNKIVTILKRLISIGNYQLRKYGNANFFTAFRTKKSMKYVLCIEVKPAQY